MSFASTILFIAAAVVVALLVPDQRDADLPTIVGLTLAYTLLLRVRFEFADLYVAPEQLLFVSVALICPLPYVAIVVATASVLSMIPDAIEGAWHPERWVGRLADCWFCLGPVIVLALLAPGEASLAHAWVYMLALGAQLLFDVAWALVRDVVVDGLRIPEVLDGMLGTARVDVVLSPIALMFAVPAADDPLVLLTLLPLIWMLEFFARDRQARYASALELQRAYRGTVTLLSDVVEFEDPYTAAHSRSIVELAEVVGEKLGVPRHDRQRLEFAALLHDVGKIAIPKDILNKPASLTAEEFDLMKTHTMEGQFMLDRVGGLLGEIGEIVRSCHERWDGSGYPDGIAGESIPLPARIVFACDSYNAMTTDRVYRPALSTEEAVAELTLHSGSQFDPVVVGALLEVVEEGEPVVASTDGIRAILAQQGALPDRVGVTA